MLLPLTLYLAASCSYDSIMLACILLLLAFFQKGRLNVRQMVVAVLAVVLITHLKPHNILFAVPLFFIGGIKRFSGKLAVFASVGGVLFVNYLMSIYIGFFNLFGEIGRLDLVDPTQQLIFMITNPHVAIAIMFGTLYENGFFLTDFGLLGYNDTVVPLVNVFSPLYLVLFAMISASKLPQEKNLTSSGFFLTIWSKYRSWIFVLIALAYGAAALAGIYMTHTPVAMVRVIGMQVRYILPAFFLLLISFSNALRGKVSIKISDGATLSLAAVFSLLSLIAYFVTTNAVV